MDSPTNLHSTNLAGTFSEIGIMDSINNETG